MTYQRQHQPKIISNQENRETDLLLSFIWFDSLDGEVWREIKHTDGMNYVSNRGRVLSLYKDGVKLLKPYLRSDYLCVSIQQDGVWKDERINRLVAIYFIDNPDNKPLVHHKNLNKLDNNVDNLVWMTDKEHCAEHARLNRLMDKKDASTLLPAI